MNRNQYKNILVGPDIHRRIKIRAAFEGITIRALIERLFTEYEKQHENPHHQE